MANPQETWRAMTSGSRSRFTLGTAAKNVILPTIDILGPQRSLRNMHQFIVRVCFREGFTSEDTARMACHSLLQDKEIIEVMEQRSADSLFPGTKFYINSNHHRAMERAQAQTIPLVGREIARDALAEMVELQVEGDVAHRRVEIMARNLKQVPTDFS